MSTPDAELVAQALEGSQEAYRRLVRRYQRPVIGLILRLVRDPATAEDLAQETFVKAFRHLERFEPKRKLSSWLFKIAHNTAIDHLRRRRPPTVPLERGGGDDEPSWEVLAAPETEAPDLAAARGQLAGAVEAALGELRPAYRTVLLLRCGEGLSYREIEEVTGLPMGTVKVQLHRARKQLAAALAARGWQGAETS